MEKVYQHIEPQALEIYHSNESWALKQWALNNILKEEVVTEATVQLASEIVSPVMEWQTESFDPIVKFRTKLIADGKPPESIRICMIPVGRFAARKGRKTRYSNDDIIEHVSWLRTTGYVRKYKVYTCPECGNNLPRIARCNNCGCNDRKKMWAITETKWEQVPYKDTTLNSDLFKLQQLFRCIYNDRNWCMPVEIPDMPDEMYQPMLSDDEVETLIVNTIIDNIPDDWIIRLLVSTLYGDRASELGDIESKYINLDGDESSIYIRTRKEGQRKSQPIPQSLLPLFAIPVQPMKRWLVYYILQSMCDKAGVVLPERAGWHSLRRRSITDVYHDTNVKEMPIIDYFRWSRKQRGLSQLPTYVRTPVSVTDREVLAQHPIVKMLENVVQLLCELHPEYSNNPRVKSIYKQML